MPTIKLPGDLVLAEINALAANLFAMHGQRVSDGYKFYAASCELGRQCWNAAVITYFNTAILNSGIPVANYLLPEFTVQPGNDTPSNQPMVTY